MKTKNRFCFVVPMFNASATLPRMLHSVYGQSYDNWHVFLIDDVSNDLEREKYRKTLAAFEMLDADRVTTIWNDEKKWEVKNVLEGVSRCESDDIVCRLDADDWLVDLDSLSYLNAVYNRTSADAVWTAHRWGFTDRNISGPMSHTVDVYKHPWVSSHFKTFRRRLLDGVPLENFLNENGEFIKRAGDQCVYLPALQNAKHFGFINRVMYHYTIDEQGGAVYQTDDAKFQKSEADFIRERGYVSTGSPWEDAFKK